MDNTVLLFSGISFLCFLCSLPVLFRLIHAFDAISSYLKMVFLYAIIHTIIWFWLGYSIEGFIIMELIYTLACILFLFGIFGILEASITLHLLLKIGLTKDRSIQYSDISELYNKKQIIQKRIARFLWSKDIVYRNDSYELVSHSSLYQLREYLLNVLKWLYP